MNLSIIPPNMRFSYLKAVFTTRIHEHIPDVISRDLGISKNDIYFPIQKHTNRIYLLESDLNPKVADAVLTVRKGIVIGVQVADCVPVLLLDKELSVIGAVHAGWKGTAGEIIKKTVTTMQNKYNSKAADIVIALGPSIRRCCYDVDEKVKDAVQKVTGQGPYCRKKNDKYALDLSSANRMQALSMGVLEKNIWQSDECTFCNPARFYSYRYNKHYAGRQSGFIGIW